MRVMVGGRHKPSNKQLKKAAAEQGEDPDAVTEGTGSSNVAASTGPATGADASGARDAVLDEGGDLSKANEQDAKEAKDERDQAVGLVAKGMQDALGDFADTLEMFQKCVSCSAS